MSVIVALVAAGCGGSDDEPEAAPTATVAIEEAPTATPPPEPTATPAPTAPPTATEAPAPTPTPEPSDEEAAIRAAWERYLDLSIQARGKDPSAESLDFDSYVTGGARDALEDAASGPTYLAGVVTSIRFEYFINEAGDARVSDCLSLSLNQRARSDDEEVGVEERVSPYEARLERVGSDWIVAAFQPTESDRCDG